MKTLKKYLCLLLTTIMLVTPATQSAFGQENSHNGFLSAESLFQEEGTYFELIDQGNDSYSAVALTDNLFESMSYDSLIKDTRAAYRADGILYNQLNDRQKLFYNFMDESSIDTILASPNYNNNSNNKEVSKSIAGVSGQTFTGYLDSSGEIYITSSQTESFKRIFHDMQTANMAYYYDAPASIWCTNADAKLALTDLGNNTIRVDAVSYIYNLTYKGKEKQMYQEMNAAVDNIIATVVDPNADRYTKVLSVYQYLIKNNKYSTDLKNNPLIIHLPYSALILNDAYDPVCNGYSSAFKMICDKLKIPCVMPTSMGKNSIGENEGHAWNNVKMDDGYWYNLDATSDGSDSPTVNTDFFLVGNDTLAKYGSVFTESASYNSTLGNGAIRFTFPVKSKSNYEYIGGPKFPDIKAGAWYYDTILSSAKIGLFKGDDEGYFNPSKGITRAEFAAVLANLYKSDLSGYTISTFPDIKNGAWYLKAVEWAKTQGYMSGDKEGTFRPMANISRQEMCIVFANIENKRQDNPTNLFIDDSKIADYAYGAVYYCKELNLVVGDTEGNFNPLSHTTRAEAASVFSKYQKIIAE